MSQYNENMVLSINSTNLFTNNKLGKHDLRKGLISVQCDFNNAQSLSALSKTYAESKSSDLMNNSN
jgi:hypothetical protein